MQTNQTEPGQDGPKQEVCGGKPEIGFFVFLALAAAIGLGLLFLRFS